MKVEMSKSEWRQLIADALRGAQAQVEIVREAAIRPSERAMSLAKLEMSRRNYLSIADAKEVSIV